MKRLVLAALLLSACGSSDEDSLRFDLDRAWPQPSLLPAVTGPRLGVTNSGEDTLSFVDAASFNELGRVPVGAFPVELEGPHHLAPTPDGRFVFVGISNTLDPGAAAGGPHGSHGLGAADGYLLKFDASTGREVARVRAERSPGDVRIEPVRGRVWQSHYDLYSFSEALQRYNAGEISWDEVRAASTSAVIVTDGDTMERIARVPICAASHGIGFSPDGSAAWVSCAWSDAVARVDTGDFSVQVIPVGPNPSEFTTSRYAPYAVTVAPDGKVWVSNSAVGNRGLRVIDPNTRAEIPELALATEGLPLFGAFESDGARFYVVTQNPDRLLQIDPATAEVQQQVELSPLGCVNAHAAVLSPDEGTLWIVCEGDHLALPGTLERFETARLTPTGHLEVGLFPDDVAFLPAPAQAVP